MKLSAAIRIGSMTTKQITHEMTDGGNGRCALGAAMDACGKDIPGNTYSPVWLREFPILANKVIHPVTGRSRSDFGTPWTVMYVVAILNDLYGWSREQIADWVESIEAGTEKTVDQEHIEFAVPKTTVNA